MNVDRYPEPQAETNMLATLRRAALVAFCAVLVAVIGVGVPYKAYKYFKEKQHAERPVLHEEL